LSVIVAAPAVFSFTGVANPERHATCDKILQEARTSSPSPHDHQQPNKDAGQWLAEEIRYLCQDLDVGLGLAKEFHYTEQPRFVEVAIVTSLKILTMVITAAARVVPYHTATETAKRLIGSRGKRSSASSRPCPSD
jgi:hypothetical protein